METLIIMALFAAVGAGGGSLLTLWHTAAGNEARMATARQLRLLN